MALDDGAQYAAYQYNDYDDSLLDPIRDYLRNEYRPSLPVDSWQQIYSQPQILYKDQTRPPSDASCDDNHYHIDDQAEYSRLPQVLNQNINEVDMHDAGIHFAQDIESESLPSSILQQDSTDETHAVCDGKLVHEVC